LGHCSSIKFTHPSVSLDLCPQSTAFADICSAIMCALAVQTSNQLPSLFEWIFFCACAVWYLQSGLPSRAEAIALRLAQCRSSHDRSMYPCTGVGHAARQDLLASKDFTRYVQSWMLVHVISAPVMTQARIWPVIIRESLRTAAVLLVLALFFGSFTLALCGASNLDISGRYLLQWEHSFYGFLVGQLHLDEWRAGRLLHSNDRIISMLRRPHGTRPNYESSWSHIFTHILW
jgi:hypothetical protein